MTLRIQAPFEVDGINYDYSLAVAGDNEDLSGNYCATQPMLNLINDHESTDRYSYCHMCRSDVRAFHGVVWKAVSE